MTEKPSGDQPSSALPWIRAAAEKGEPESLVQSPTADDEDLRYKASTRKLRGQYAIWLLGVLALQIAATNLIFLAVGFQWLTYDALTLQIFVGATVTQVVALVLVIVRHLFPHRT